MMRYGLSELAVIPVRRDADERSEMVTQVLFGETFQIMDTIPKWSYIKISFDAYEGWINTNCITELTEELFTQINSNKPYICKNIIQEIANNKEEKVTIPFGSELPDFNSKTNTFTIINKQYLFQNPVKTENFDITLLAKQFLNVPYLWGGKNPFGIDCSGLVQVLYKAFDKKLPRDANKQVSVGNTINFISDSQAGDLAFFDDQEGKITHVGMIVNKNEIIHSSVKVRMDKIDQQGIYNEDLKRYTHKLRIIKRIL